MIPLLKWSPFLASPQPWKMPFPQGFRAFRLWKLMHGFDCVTLKYHTKIALKIGNTYWANFPIESKKVQKNAESWSEKEDFMSIPPFLRDPTPSCYPPLFEENFQSPFFGFSERVIPPLKKGGGSNYGIPKGTEAPFSHNLSKKTPWETTSGARDDNIKSNLSSGTFYAPLSPRHYPVVGYLFTKFSNEFGIVVMCFDGVCIRTCEMRSTFDEIGP